MLARSQAGQRICMRASASSATSAPPLAGKRVSSHASASTRRPMHSLTGKTRPQPRQHVSELADTSPTTSARPQAGKRIRSRVSMSASRPARSCASKRIPDYVGASACRPISSAYVHYKYIFSVSFVLLTIYFPAPCSTTHPRPWPSLVNYTCR